MSADLYFAMGFSSVGMAYLVPDGMEAVIDKALWTSGSSVLVLCTSGYSVWLSFLRGLPGKYQEGFVRSIFGSEFPQPLDLSFSRWSSLCTDIVPKILNVFAGIVLPGGGLRPHSFSLCVC